MLKNFEGLRGYFSTVLQNRGPKGHLFYNQSLGLSLYLSC